MNGDELHQWVGSCVRKAISHMVWKTPINFTDVCVRLISTYEAYIKRLRSTSPCHCVMQRSYVACTVCPLDLTDVEKTRAVREIMTEAVMQMRSELRHFPEYRRDKSEDYNDPM